MILPMNDLFLFKDSY